MVDADHTFANEANNVNALLSLTPAETARYRQVCRAHGITVTDLMLALLALAEIESTLQVALKSDNGELTAKNIGAYEQASHFLFGFYFINHVSWSLYHLTITAHMFHIHTASQAPWRIFDPRGRRPSLRL